MSEETVGAKRKPQLITPRVLSVNRKTGQERWPVYNGGARLKHHGTGKQIDLEPLSDSEIDLETETEGSTGGSPERR